VAKRGAPEIVDASKLTDADWAEVNMLRRAYEKGGQKAFSKALDELGERDPAQYLTIAAAYFPQIVRELIQDNIAAKGLTEEEFRELFHMEANPTRH
jgi:hypothetical protein